MTVAGTWTEGCAVIVADACVSGMVVDPAEVVVVGSALAELLTEGPATVVGDSDRAWGGFSTLVPVMPTENPAGIL